MLLCKVPNFDNGSLGLLGGDRGAVIHAMHSRLFHGNPLCAGPCVLISGPVIGRSKGPLALVPTVN